jgi:hypothetical protein
MRVSERMSDRMFDDGAEIIRSAAPAPMFRGG